MSFEDLYNQYYSLILNYINKKIQNYSDAEDLAMDTFLSIYKNFDSYDSRKANYNTWIFVIVNNKIKNYYRDKKENYDIDDNIIIDDDFSSQVVAAEYIVEMRQTLYEALKTINALQRKIIIYKFFYISSPAKHNGSFLECFPHTYSFRISKETLIHAHETIWSKTSGNIVAVIIYIIASG